MAHDPSAFISEYFRVRADTVGLNVDSGWLGAENVSVSVNTGVIFRLLIKVRETAGGSDTTAFKLQVNRNSGGWVDVDKFDSVSLVSPAVLQLTSQFADGDATSTRLLTNVSTYVSGEGVETAANNLTGNYSLTNEEAEFEWALMMHSTYSTGSGAGQNVASDTLEFRIVESDGTVFTGTYVNPTITVIETDFFVGGTFCESPGFIGPTTPDGNGNIYMVKEAAHLSDADFPIMMKSEDGCKTWEIMDLAGSPGEELEAAHIFQDGDTLHLLAQGGGRGVFYSKFYTSDHATLADTWDNTIIEEEVQADDGTIDDQGCGIVVRPSDGAVIAVFRGQDGTDQRIYYRIRNGSWGTATLVDDTATTAFIFSGIVLGASSKIHIFYKNQDADTLYHRSLDSGDSLGTIHTVESDILSGLDDWGTSPPIFWDNGGTEEIMILVHDESDLLGYSVVISNDGTPDARKVATDNTVEEHRAGSHQSIMDLVVDPATNIAYLQYSDQSTRDLFRNEADNDDGWGTEVEVLDGVHIDSVRGAVFTHSAGNGGKKVLGYFYVNSPSDSHEGFCGDVWYGEYEIPSLRRVFITHV